MTRTKKFITGVLSGYALTVVNILFSIGSIPLALYYLGREEFGLWALVAQLAGYLALLDLGMSVAIARFLADYKDDVNGGRYGSVLKTGQVVFLIQAVLIAVLGMALILWSPQFLRIPETLQHSFVVLMSVQCLLSAMGFGVKMTGSPLWCHQRYDITNLAAAASLVCNFFAMWAGFVSGWGVYSMLFGAALGFVANLALPGIACWRLGYFPKRGHWGHFEWSLFREMFLFGKDMFLMSLGGQLASASQVIVLSRFMGLEAVSIWAVASKAYSFCQQFVGRIFDSSSGGLAEMHIRGEHARVRTRFQDLIMLTGAVSAVAGAGIALFNTPFVQIWTSGRIHWSEWNNYLLGVFLVVSMVTRCHTGLVGITKDIRGMKYIYLAEGIGVIGLAVLLVPRFGIAGMLCASILSNLCITGIYGIRRSSAFFAVPAPEIASWQARAGLLTALLFAGSLALRAAGFSDASWLWLGIQLALFFAVAIPGFYWLGLGPGLQSDVRRFCAGRFGQGTAH